MPNCENTETNELGTADSWSGRRSTELLTVMKHSARSLLIVMYAIGVVIVARAAAPVTFDSHTLTEVWSLTDLANGIVSALGNPAGIADRGRHFNATDVVDAKYPMRRFIVGGVSDEYVVVCYEQGGRGYSIQAEAYAHSSHEWTQVNHWQLQSKPAGLGDLIRSLVAAQK